MNCGCTSLRVPAMHVNKELAGQRRNQYLAKHAELSLRIGHAETLELYYNADNFRDFLDTKVLLPGCKYLRIYIGSLSKKLTLVYATNDPANPKRELYYVINGNSHTAINIAGAIYSVSEYRTIHWPILNRLNPGLTKGDTVCIRHSYEDIQELKAEIDCQRPTGIKACLSSYLNNDVHFDYRNMLFVEFVFTKINSNGIEEEFHIDECSDFLLRPKPRDKVFAADFNNGTLCPPCTGCDDDVTLLPPC